MNKAELIQAVAAQSGESKSTVERVLTGFDAAVSNELAAGGSVALSGFGSFAVADKPERQGRNPRTGEPFQIPEIRVPGFRAFGPFKEKVRAD